MNQGLIPRRYAKALYKLAADRGSAASLYDLMRHLAASFEAQPALAAVMANPFVAPDDKRALVHTACGIDIQAGKAGKDAEKGEKADKADKADDAVALLDDFVTLLVSNKRIDMLRPMALAYIDIYRKAHDIFSVIVTTAAPMPDNLRQRLTALIHSHLPGATIELDERVDPDLIGGFTVQMQSERLDASVRTQLQQLRQQFNR